MEQPEAESPLNLDGAARALAVPRWQIDRWIAEGRIAVVDEHVTLDALRAFAESLPTEPYGDLALDDPTTHARAARLIRAGLARPQVVNRQES